MEVKLLDYMGDDLEVVNDARVSFDKESDWENVCVNQHDACSVMYDCEYCETRLSEKDQKLIDFLAREGHWTPFANGGTVKLYLKVPIFVLRQLQKHQAGFEPFNEVSRRYVATSPEFYMPEEFRKGSKDIKQGSTDEIVDDAWLDDIGLGLLREAEEVYSSMLDRGVCREQARMFLPQNMYTQIRWKGNIYAWANLYNKRTAPDAQKEVRDVAHMIGDIIEPLFPYSWRSLTK